MSQAPCPRCKKIVEWVPSTVAGYRTADHEFKGRRCIGGTRRNLDATPDRARFVIVQETDSNDVFIRSLQRLAEPRDVPYTETDGECDALDVEACPRPPGAVA